jgi:hypothetical protein
MSTSSVVPSQPPPPAPVVAAKKKNPFLAMSAGCIAGGIEATAVWPMEYIKVRLDRVLSWALHLRCIDSRQHCLSVQCDARCNLQSSTSSVFILVVG